MSKSWFENIHNTVVNFPHIFLFFFFILLLKVLNKFPH